MYSSSSSVCVASSSSAIRFAPAEPSPTLFILSTFVAREVKREEETKDVHIRAGRVAVTGGRG